VQPFSLAGHIRILESYRVPHHFLFDQTLFILLKISSSGHSTDMEHVV